MKKINKTKYVILGLLAEKPRSGYEIKQFIQEFMTHFWQESDASIYPMLKTLEAEKCVASRSEYVGRRERKMFEITAAGKKDFSQWLALPAEEEGRRKELLLKLFFSANARKKDAIQQLMLHQKKIEEAEQQFKDIQENELSKVSDKYPHKLFWLMALNNGIMQVNAERRWLAESFKMLDIKKKKKRN